MLCAKDLQRQGFHFIFTVLLNLLSLSVKTFSMPREFLNDMCSHLSDFFVIWPVIFFDIMLPHSEIELGGNLKINLQMYFYLNK